MTKIARRQFLVAGAALGMGAVSPVAGAAAKGTIQQQPQRPAERQPPEDPLLLPSPIDFRYSPLSWQTVYCFPDDPHKSLVGERGELRYGHPGLGYSSRYFPFIVEFSLSGMERTEIIRQELEAPGVPIVHTYASRPEAFFELITFATRRSGEGRVDNVILQVSPRSEGGLHARPIVRLETSHAITVHKSGGETRVFARKSKTTPLAAIDSRLDEQIDFGRGMLLRFEARPYSDDRPLQCFFRFPQEGQEFDAIQDGLKTPQSLLAEARLFWQAWSPFGEDVAWTLPRADAAFLAACARNIQQARELRDGKLTFEVGPTVYRGLWIADGNFILEAARYLGYDRDAQAGLETEWSRQRTDGAIFGGAGTTDWKDTGIAMFTMVRQAELSQDWSYFRAMKPNVLRAVGFLINLHARAKAEGGVMGRYGLLPPGYGDGGLGGVRPEFANTLWALAGLKAVISSARGLQLEGFETAEQFYHNLRLNFFAAARQEMRRYPTGFEYLPMLMKEDPQWSKPDPWDRPPAQVSQYALSQAIYPGLLFNRDDPIVKGHIALMQACTQEDVPAETGWLHHGGLWTYDAAFAAQVYLWAGLKDWARLTFGGFLNHASPLYCWREEQPLQGSLVARYLGDMPHNWASAECILYLRNRLAFEAGRTLRLLSALGDPELAHEEPSSLSHSPTRFGRISLDLTPLDRHKGWRLVYHRAGGPTPSGVELPAALGTRLRFSGLKGAQFRQSPDVIMVSPEAGSWEALWTV